MKDKRLLVIALCLVVAIVLFRNYFLIPRSDAMKEDIFSQQKVLQKYEEYVQGGAMTAEEIQAVLEEMQDLEKRLVDGKSEFLAVALLQEEITELSAKAGLKITTIRPSGVTKAEKYLVLPVFFEGYGNIKQVSDFLRNIESSKYLMRIDKLNVNIMNIQNPKDLKVKIQISGLGRA